MTRNVPGRDTFGPGLNQEAQHREAGLLRESAESFGYIYYIHNSGYIDINGYVKGWFTP
ncbi:MAG: hypothetical protein LW837_09235 [Roseomonas sp.]|nr:hypothetical protein [Roseomonas sp.]